MMTDWQEFKGGEHKTRYKFPRVTMSKSGEIRFGRRALEVLDRPRAVTLYFDVSRSCIGVKPVTPSETSFEMVRREDTSLYAYVRGSSFCKHYGIKPEASIEFVDVEMDADGIMVLDLKTARRLRR